MPKSSIFWKYGELKQEVTTAFILSGNAPKTLLSEEYFTDLRERCGSLRSAPGRQGFTVFSGLGVVLLLNGSAELLSFFDR